MRRKVTISVAGSASQDLEELLTFYTGQGVPEEGRRLVVEIIRRIESLQEHPDIGRMVPEFGLEHLRELIHPPFRIVYRRDSKRVRIVRIWRSERLLKLP